jgi:predicted MFS family arabinose efflux permease
VQVLSAPGAIIVDAASYLLSGLCLVWIRQPERSPDPPDAPSNLWGEMGSGVRFVTGHRTLRALLGCTAMSSFFNAALEAVFLLYFTQHLGLNAVQLGIIFGAGSVGFLLGALLPTKLANITGIGPSIMIGMVILALADFIAPLVWGPIWVIVALLMIAQLFFGLGLTLFSVGQVSVRQASTPDALQGRMNATFDFAVSGIIPLGALVGGLAGELVGLRSTLVLAAAGELLSVAWLLWSPMRTMRTPIVDME